MKERNVYILVGYVFSNYLATRFIWSVAVEWSAFLFHTREFWGHSSVHSWFSSGLLGLCCDYLKSGHNFLLSHPF
jgi:hypothetical protein